MDKFMHLCNGRDLHHEKVLGFNGAKCYVRDTWGSPTTMSRVEELRGFGCFFEQMKLDILQSQLFDANLKMVSGCTQFRNGISYQTNAAIQNICFGFPSLLYHYKQICPLASIFLGDVTTDHNERHFNNLKSRGAKTHEEMAQAESRGNYHDVLNTSLFVRTGIRSVTTSLRKRKVKGNSESTIDENLHMGDDRVPSPKRRKKLAPLRVNLRYLPNHYKVNHNLPKVKLRMGMKNKRGVRANGVHVAPCGL
jgi:hypothetical protein